MLRSSCLAMVTLCVLASVSAQSDSPDSFLDNDVYLKIDTSFTFERDSSDVWNKRSRVISFTNMDGIVTKRLHQKKSSEGYWLNKRLTLSSKPATWTDLQIQYRWDDKRLIWVRSSRTTVDNFEWSTEDRFRTHENFDTVAMKWDTSQTYQKIYDDANNAFSEYFFYYDQDGIKHRGRHYLSEKDDKGDVVSKKEYAFEEGQWKPVRKTLQDFQEHRCETIYYHWNDDDKQWRMEPRKVVLEYFRESDNLPNDPLNCNPFRQIKNKRDFRLDKEGLWFEKRRTKYIYEIHDSGWNKIRREMEFDSERQEWENSKQYIQYFNDNGRIVKDEHKVWDSLNKEWKHESRTRFVPESNYQKTIQEDWKNGKWHKSSIRQGIPCYPVEELKT